MKQAFLASKALGLRLLSTIADEVDDALVLHPDDSADGRSVLPEIASLCRRRGWQFQVVSKRAEADVALETYRPDIAFVCGWYWLIRDGILALAPRGFYGIHNSLLPQYRGGAPLVWAIINGEREVGSTLFRLEGGVDDGAIAHQVSIHIDRRATIATTTARIEEAWEEAFPAIWGGLCAGTAELCSQDIAGTPQWPNRKPSDGEIDWALPAAQIHDFIRAQSTPYPGAFTDFGPVESSEETWLNLDTVVGEPIKVGEALFVRCGDGKSLKVGLRSHNSSTEMPSSPPASVATASDR